MEGSPNPSVIQSQSFSFNPYLSIRYRTTGCKIRWNLDPVATFWEENSN
jgi:hypothetical protein